MRVKMSQILVWRCSRRKPYIIWPAGWAQEEEGYDRDDFAYQGCGGGELDVGHDLDGV